jgi:hypothetical protein
LYSVLSTYMPKEIRLIADRVRHSLVELYWLFAWATLPAVLHCFRDLPTQWMFVSFFLSPLFTTCLGLFGGLLTLKISLPGRFVNSFCAHTKRHRHRRIPITAIWVWSWMLAAWESIRWTRYALCSFFKPQENGECKGYAFIEFHSIEHSQYFMAAFGNNHHPNFDHRFSSRKSCSLLITTSCMIWSWLALNTHWKRRVCVLKTLVLVLVLARTRARSHGACVSQRDLQVIPTHLSWSSPTEPLW